MRAITICVDYLDILSITLPLMRKFFDEYWVITDSEDRVNVSPLCEKYNCNLVVTDLFYIRNSPFAKYAALEHGLDCMSRNGWITILDADVVWPSNAHYDLKIGNLYTPLRRMCPLVQNVPAESDWWRYPIHRNIAEWAGYSQTFHADDRCLGPAPWHETNWKHAGGADSMFQRKWPLLNRIRPSWECLHIGDSGVNWCGRVSNYLDGTTPLGVSSKVQVLHDLMSGRRVTRNFDREKF